MGKATVSYNMRVLLIGNFAPPYEEESLHNLTLLNQLKQDGNKCHIINISESPAEIKDIVNAKNYLDFIIKLIRHGYRCNIIHFLTKGYVRPGLMKLMTTIIIGKFLLKRIIITLHPEMFSILGQLRSKMGGQQLLHLSFSLADRIICGDTHTFEVASIHYKAKDKFEIIPPFIHIPEETKEVETTFEKLKNKKRIIVFSGVKSPSFIFDILSHLLTKYLDTDIGIAVSLYAKKSEQLKHVIEEIGNRLANNMVFIEPTDNRLLSIAYAKADLVLRTLSCDGKPLFYNIAITVKRPLHSENYLYFPISLTLIKEGETDLCAYIFNLLMEKTEALPEPRVKDFYEKIKGIYLK